MEQNKRAALQDDIAIVRRNLAEIILGYQALEKENAGLKAKCDRYEAVLKEISTSTCDHENVNFKSKHSPDCNACKAALVLQEFLSSGEGNKEVENG